MLSGLTSGEVSGHVIVACFLIREGADVRAVGETALDSCDPEVAVILSTFADKYAGYITLSLYVLIINLCYHCICTLLQVNFPFASVVKEFVVVVVVWCVLFILVTVQSNPNC